MEHPLLNEIIFLQPVIFIKLPTGHPISKNRSREKKLQHDFDDLFHNSFEDIAPHRNFSALKM